MKIRVKFHEPGKSYTYETDLPVEVGDEVLVPAGDEEKGAVVVSLTSTYDGPCKQVIGVV